MTTNEAQSLLEPTAPLAPDPGATGAGILSERSVPTLMSGIIADVQHLIEQQLAMFRQEIRDDVRKGKKAALSLAVSAAIALAGGLLLLLMLPLLLNWAVPAWPLWACFGIIGGFLATLGGALLYVNARKIESFDLLSNQAVEAFKENLTWTTKPT
jgi:hypothetical protein